MQQIHGEEDWRHWVPAPAGRVFDLCRKLPELPGLWDLAERRDVIPHWTALLRSNARYLLEVLGAEGWDAERRRAARALAIFERLLDDLDRGRAGEIRTVHHATLVREHLLRGHDLPDPYRGIKAREASRWLPEASEALSRAWRCGEATPTQGALATVLGDLLAGNLFDLGSSATREAFRRGSLNMEGARRGFAKAARQSLERMDAGRRDLLLGPARPLDAPAAGHMLLFADNAGADFLLGVLPAALFFARRWAVKLVVNSLPASNDVSMDEARAHLALLRDVPACPVAQAMAAGRLELVASGTGSPGIDVRHVGDALNRAAQGTAWMLIEGQGRAIESNWPTRFRCPVLRAAAVKDSLVAAEIGAAPGSALLSWDADESERG